MGAKQCSGRKRRSAKATGKEREGDRKQAWPCSVHAPGITGALFKVQHGARLPMLSEGYVQDEAAHTEAQHRTEGGLLNKGRRRGDSGWTFSTFAARLIQQPSCHGGEDAAVLSFLQTLQGSLQEQTVHPTSSPH
ncbi:hypothetical protein OJAV_G00181270 [Oryzias javanicus]|uniref:Uncharacterized protein n=1 Tax=Oryzias javanicus TaxID=123683 RepID=A0A437CDQ1_ORYJA|nr:hypothetical protein OJAV_G00181270 [Oryzias javanicus]